MIIRRFGRESGCFRGIFSAAVAMLTVMLIGFSVRAELVSEEDMDRAGANWLSYVLAEDGAWAGSTDPEIIAVEEIRDGDRIMARCYRISPLGFIVVPVLRQLPPVKAYSVENNLEIDARHGLGALLHDVLREKLNLFEAYYGGLEAVPPEADDIGGGRQISRAWDIFTLDKTEFGRYLDSPGRGSRDQVGPLLTTAWHQTAPYNNYCPMGDGNRCVVWCVATALAQILWYHQWPPAGLGHTEYIWNGDQSCGGSTPGRLLSANFSDGYGWSGTIDEIAEISFEVGMAYNVDYGVCYSIGYAEPVLDLLPDNFAYRRPVLEYHRNEHSGEAWFAMIQDEINNDRPIQYLIYNHMIVADGWSTVDSLKYYHMNYGWGGGSNGWYALDDLYCAWEGCDPMVEVMYTNIYPDRGIMFYADTIAGAVPFEVAFESSSDGDVKDYIWSFGDGDSALAPSPTHTFTAAGIYDVSLELDFGDSTRRLDRPAYIYAIDDSLFVGGGSVDPGEHIEVTISAANIMPLSGLTIPVKYDGSLALAFDSLSVVGCRTESFQQAAPVDDDPTGKRLTVDLRAWLSGYSDYPYLAAGNGPVLKLYFTVSSSAESGQATDIRVEAYQDYESVFYGSIYGQAHPYQATAVAGQVEVELLCGDTDGDGIVNLLDITYLIDYLYRGGPPPVDGEAADVNHDGSINILDITYLIDFLYKGGPAPDCP